MTSSPRDPLFVGFRGHAVQVRCRAPALHEGLAEAFRDLLVPPRTATLAAFDARDTDDGYELHGPSSTTTAPSAAAAARQLRFAVIEQFVAATPSLVWLHAGAAAHHGRALLVAGFGGHGKSTLVTRLCREGWRFLSDDILPFDPASGMLVPFPQTPAIRDDPGRPMPHTWLSTAEKRSVVLDRTAVATEPHPIGAVLFPIRRPDEPVAIVPCTAGEAAVMLLACCWTLERDGDAAARALCDLLHDVDVRKVYHPTADDGADAVVAAARTWW